MYLRPCMRTTCLDKPVTWGALGFDERFRGGVRCCSICWFRIIWIATSSGTLVCAGWPFGRIVFTITPAPAQLKSIFLISAEFHNTSSKWTHRVFSVVGVKTLQQEEEPLTCTACRSSNTRQCADSKLKIKSAKAFRFLTTFIYVHKVPVRVKGTRLHPHKTAIALTQQIYSDTTRSTP